MLNDFPRILTLLRKEKNISQKQAAEDLGVAQALLSHYEKGKDVAEPEKARNLTAEELSSVFAKKLVTNSVDVLYSLLAKTKNGILMDKVYDIFACAVYRSFRLIYKTNPANDKNLFKISEETAEGLVSAQESITGAKAELAISGSNVQAPPISRPELEREYGKSASVLLNMVMHCEKQLEKL